MTVPTQAKTSTFQRAVMVIGTALIALGLLALMSLSRQTSVPKSVTLDTTNRPATAPSAKNEVIVYADFRCPACQQFHQQIPALKQLLGNDGRIVYLNRLVKGEAGLPLAATAECVFRAEGINGYERVATQLYAEAALQGEANTAWINPDNLLRLARPVDPAGFRTCLTDPAVTRMIQAEDQAIAKQGGNSTPGLAVNGKGVRPTLADVKQALQSQMLK